MFTERIGVSVLGAAEKQTEEKPKEKGTHHEWQTMDDAALKPSGRG